MESEEVDSNCPDKVYSEDQDGRISRSTNVIFSHVIATFAMEMLDCIHGDKEEFLKDHMTEHLNYLHNDETGAHCVYGSLDDIVEYRNKLEAVIDTDRADIGINDGYVKGDLGIDDGHVKGDLCLDDGHVKGMLGIDDDHVKGDLGIGDDDDGSTSEPSKTYVGTDADHIGTDNNQNNETSTELDIGKEKSLDGKDTENTTKSYRDIRVDCDPNKETVEGKNLARTVKDVKVGNKNNIKTSDAQKIDTDTESTCDILQKAASEILKPLPVVISKTKRGRPIKKPLKLQQEALDDTVLDEEIDEPKPARKQRRRLLKCTKRGRVIKPRDRGKISVEEVRRLVQAEKEKEQKDKDNTDDGNKEEDKAAIDISMLNAGVLQTMFLNSWNEYQDQGSQKDSEKIPLDIKEMEQKKQMKKYYEDRMPFKYFCDKCSFKTKRESHYQAHMNLHERKPNMTLFNCKHCDFVSIRQSVLNRHKLTHSENLISCPSNCSFKTHSQKILKTHTNKHLKSLYLDPDSLHTCDLCPFRTMSRLKLATHKALHGQHLPGNSKLGKNELTYKCDECSYKTTKRVHLVRHQDNVHSNKRPYLCDLCGAAFKRVDALAAHKTTHLERSKRKLPYVCTHCKKAFKSWAHLKEHSYVHTTVRSFQCHICGQMFKTRAVQRRHQQSIHFNPRSHKCSHCNKEFNTKYAFKRHLRIHDNDPVGHPPTQVQPQVATDLKPDVAEETIDENVSAIQTITIAPENISEFTQQLQNVSDQLQSSTDIGEIYIQGLEGVEAGTINIVSMSAQEIRQIFIPSDTADPNAMLTPNDQVKQIFVSSKSNNPSTSDNIEMAELKELYVQPSSASGATRPILLTTVNRSTGTGFQATEALSVDLVEAGSQIIEAGQPLEVAQSMEGNQALIEHHQEAAGIQRTEEGMGDKTEVKNQTLELKLEGGQTLLTLGSTAVQNL